MGGSGTYTGSASQNTWMISEMRANGYKNGGTIGDLINKTGEDGFILARSGEEVLSIDQIKALSAAFDSINSTIDTFESALAHKADLKAVPNHAENKNIDNVNFNVNLPNVESYEDFKHELQHDSHFETMVQDMTVNLLFDGGSKIKKYRRA